TDAHIPDTYIRNEIQRLDMYKRIAGINSRESLLDISEEMTDRYGDIPTPAQNLLDIALLKAKAHDVYITSLTQKGLKVNMKLFEKARLDITRLPELKERFGGRLKLVPGEHPYFDFSLEIPRKKLVKILTPKEIFAQLDEVIEAIGAIKLKPED
ncbi:MAG: transcription-repair coupling factor, partial [Lachnospiraceae bacterium]|nr:transcription-repair coupling factor [Lachnospiraceae bacterium]